ncbi:hypothetical protein [Terricaulis sp.]|uniref:hypothetical protein n=1 Tax=Terricaulis sp. TaxID=2768686 RepID=UPI002AC54299|nr:hypothetical protein [Terricaulis sp.]MDZ4690741.1 hypothetical protein [Terricaulis sp.]
MTGLSSPKDDIRSIPKVEYDVTDRLGLPVPQIARVLVAEVGDERSISRGQISPQVGRTYERKRRMHGFCGLSEAWIIEEFQLLTDRRDRTAKRREWRAFFN